MSMSLTYDDAWTDLVGRCFVLGMPNASKRSTNPIFPAKI